jgi:hypothetical protein
MFRRDNDFGSDVDSDGEELTAAVNSIAKREREEFIGIQFIDLKIEGRAQNFRFGNFEGESSQSDIEISKLSNYSAIFSGANMPYLHDQTGSLNIVKSILDNSIPENKIIIMRGFDDCKVFNYINYTFQQYNYCN